MDEMKELKIAICKQNGLQEKLIAMWQANASADEILKLMKDSGVEITYEEVEKLLALMQQEQAAGIAGKDLCEDDLQKVSGGGDGMSCEATWDCELNFADVHIDPRAKCEWFHVCDEFYGIMSYKS